MNLLDRAARPAPAPDEAEEADPEEEQAAGAPHVLIARTPDGRLTFLQAIASRRKAPSPRGSLPCSAGR